VVTPPVISQASHVPSSAPGLVSQVASSNAPQHGAPMLPPVHALGVHRMPLGGVVESRRTVVGSGEPSEATPLLYVAQTTGSA
jgi:hypothetical protein